MPGTAWCRFILSLQSNAGHPVVALRSAKHAFITINFAFEHRCRMLVRRSGTRTAGNVRISSLRGKTAMLLNSTHIAHAGHPTLPEKLFSSMGETAIPSVAKLRSRSRGGLPPRALRSVREFIEAHLE